MSSLCFLCKLPILSHQNWSVWVNPVSQDDDYDDGLPFGNDEKNFSDPEEEEDEGSDDDEDEDEKERDKQAAGGEGKPALDITVETAEESMVGLPYHDDCLGCETCKMRLSGSKFNQTRLFQNKVYCGLHYADVTGSGSGEEFMQKLREFKISSLGCAEARRKSSTTLQFPVPIQACPGSSCERFPHFCKVTPGYWIECSGNGKDNPENETNSQVRYDHELTNFEDDTYGKYFHGTEHWNYFCNEEALGPVLLSIKQENVNNRDQFRVFLRTVSYSLRGLVPSSSICANRYDREAVVKALATEAQLKPLPLLGQLPSTPEELLKLDQVFIKSELKVGVVYVKEGQSTEEQILGNCKHSHLFDEFLMVLGDRIFLKGFDKYKGGLDTVHDLTGVESVYTCWSGIEIMFHVSTLLPNEENDTQKLQRKRHIGNDIVCVVFLEADNTKFSPASIKSHFLHTFIVVRTSPTHRTRPTMYQVSVVTRDEVSAFKPYLWHRSKFKKDASFRDWLLTKIVNGERASYSAPKFARMQDRTRSQLLEDIVTNLQNYIETGQMPKPYRRGSWRPIGHMRPSSPLLDSVRDTFEGFEQLSKDFMKSFNSAPHLCDIVFNVGQGKKKAKIYAVRAILGVRSRVFLEMLYGFSSTGLQMSQLPAGGTTTTTMSAMEVPKINVRKTSNFLQVPDMNDRLPNRSQPSSPIVFRAFSRLGNWAGWGIGNKRRDHDYYSDPKDKIKRWQSKEKAERDKASLDSAHGTLTLSVCADVQKIDKNKLCQTEFNIIEFDHETFQLIIEYLHSGCCPISCETVPSLICAAEHFDLPELLQACFHHAKQYINISKVCPMLIILENYYWRYTSASELVNTIMQYIDLHPKQFFNNHDYFTLSESVFQMIIGRELNISELYKFQVMLKWANKKCNKATDPELKDLILIMNRLSRDLKLYKIPPQDLIKVVLPSKTISNERILETLLYQADTGMYRIHSSYLDQCQNGSRLRVLEDGPDYNETQDEQETEKE